MNEDVRTLPHVLSHLDDLKGRLAGRRLAVFLDFDGTLALIADKPDQVVLSAGMRDSLIALAGRYPLAIISGRDSADVQGYIGIDSIVYAGGHGYDIAWPEGRKTVHDACRTAQPNLRAARSRLEEKLSDIAGILFEGKKCSFAVHYRLAPRNAEADVKAAVTSIVRDDPALRMLPGKKVLEILPAADWNKGKALMWLLHEMKLDTAETVPLYIGDDVTDEYAFEAITGTGIGILVCDEEHARAGRETAAIFTVAAPAEVGAVLDFLKAA
ncbi:MAG: trehalose-phosphatase [Rhodospirillales bacterium]